ncbi:recombination-associated protein RdgC [Gilvimarinus chinensis]|uniref:recombination-associated protein RdgC n=1 Tax=Gilvimarinus chinensis TaxID=396005 RepID=UPI000376AC0F|nr:recombination-associated protein RdgC [Gilvimarinus chinensis]
MFKNANIYTLSSLPAITSEILQEKAFEPCGKMDTCRAGFFIPNELDQLATEIDRFVVFCVATEEKILPPSVIRQYVAEKVEDIRTQENRPVGRKERENIKDEITFSLLPQAFTKRRLSMAVLDKTKHLLIVDESSAARSEEVCSLLRDALGSLKAVPVSTQMPFSSSATQWLKDGLPTSFELGNYCKLQSPKTDATHTCRNDDDLAEQVSTHIDNGLLVTALRLKHDALTFTVNESLAIKSLRFDDEKINEVADQVEDNLKALMLGNIVLSANQVESALEALCRGLGGAVNQELFEPAA